MDAAPGLLVSDPPLVFIGGDPSVDLVNTIDWTTLGPENERLLTFRRWIDWLAGAAVVTIDDARRLKTQGDRYPAEAALALQAARDARRVLRELFTAVARGAAAPAELTAFNALLTEALSRLQVGRVPGQRGREGLRWQWRAEERELSWPIWTVLWQAAQLLTSEEQRQLRVCAGLDCGWVYVDRSRNGLRRWCQMETCGTREKSRRRAARSAHARQRAQGRAAKR